MQRFFRQPLTWMVLGEVVIVAALVAVSWHVLVGATATSPLLLPAISTPQDTAAPQESPGVLSPPGPTSRAQLPGLNLDTGFWRARLKGLNAAEAQLEALEWRIVHSAMDTVNRYIESVVIPAVEHAEGVRA